MSEDATLGELKQKLAEYFEQPEQWQAAYDLLTKAAPRFPDLATMFYNWRYCTAALLDKPDLAIEIFREALEQGFWWSAEYLRTDEDLESLQDIPAFKRLVDQSERRRQKAIHRHLFFMPHTRD